MEARRGRTPALGTAPRCTTSPTTPPSSASSRAASTTRPPPPPPPRSAPGPAARHGPGRRSCEARSRRSSTRSTRIRAPPSWRRPQGPPARIQELLSVTRSPAQLLAPTPANTPQIGVVAREDLLLLDGSTVMPCVLEEEESLIPNLQVIAASLPPSPIEENFSASQLHHALVFDDSPGKSDSSNASFVSSSLKFHDSSGGGSHMDKSSSSTEDDSSSVWSIQVHASSEKGDEELSEDLGRRQ